MYWEQLILRGFEVILGLTGLAIGIKVAYQSIVRFRSGREIKILVDLSKKK